MELLCASNRCRARRGEAGSDGVGPSPNREGRSE